MPDITVPAAPALATLPNVELIHTGTWDISTGEWTVTVEDLASAVAAMECPAVRRPVLKLGHTDPRFDGEPAVGWVANMATAEDGRALVGDYTGMPGWLGDVIASAYPDRSVEGAYDFRCQLGHTHPFVLTAVALLGVTSPGVGTLESLQDVAALYGVAAAGKPEQSGTPITLTINASAQEVAVPNPRPLQIAAAVTSEDVRRAYYNGPGDSWDQWIESMELDPLQLIVMDDGAGKRYRVPVTIGAGDGEDAVSFGDPIPVVIRYEDAPKASAPDKAPIVWASRAESRPGDKPADTPKSPVTAAEAARRIHNASAQEADTHKEGDVQFTDEQLSTLRTKLGLPDDATLEPSQVLAAISDSGTAPQEEGASTGATEKVAASPKRADGTIVIDASAWEAQQASIRKLEAAAAKRSREERDQVISAAVKDGKFPPARKEHWARLWDADPEGTREVLATLQKNTVPLEELGGGADADDDLDAEFAGLFPPAPTAKGA
jgi:hypothetical protein